jgi:ElaA protein
VGGPAIRAARFAELDGRTLYDLLQLRVDVFVVEQACAYPELDGRDTEPSTVHLWIERDGRPAAYVRLLDDGREARIGRVVTAAERRGDGLAAALVRHAIALAAPAPVVLAAQSHLTAWYAALGFAADGPEFLEDGIPHTPMRLVRTA